MPFRPLRCGDRKSHRRKILARVHTHRYTGPYYTDAGVKPAEFV